MAQYLYISGCLKSTWAWVKALEIRLIFFKVVPSLKFRTLTSLYKVKTSIWFRFHPYGLKTRKPSYCWRINLRVCFTVLSSTIGKLNDLPACQNAHLFLGLSYTSQFFHASVKQSYCIKLHDITKHLMMEYERRRVAVYRLLWLSAIL